MNGDKSISDEIVKAKIRRALLSGPDSITGDATVAEMDAQGDMTVLRPGTNQWVCIPGNENIIGQADMSTILRRANDQGLVTVGRGQAINPLGDAPSPARTDGNGDSNSGDQRQATADGDSAGHSNDSWDLGICPTEKRKVKRLRDRSNLDLRLSGLQIRCQPGYPVPQVVAVRATVVQMLHPLVVRVEEVEPCVPSLPRRPGVLHLPPAPT